MEYGTIEFTDKPISRLVFGTALPEMQRGDNADEILDAVWEAGINAFDTARGYRASEKVLGDWLLRRGLQEQSVLIVKGGLDGLFGKKRIDESSVRADLAKSLQNLQAEKADIYMLHRDDERVPVSVIAELMNALRAEGKIDAFGGSNWTARRVAEVNEYAYVHNLQPFSVSGPNYSLVEQVKPMWGGGVVSIGGSKGVADRAYYEREKIAVLSYAALASGFLSGKIYSSGLDETRQRIARRTRKGFLSKENAERLRRAEVLAAQKRLRVSQVALAFLFSSGLNVFAIVSSSKPSHIVSNLAAISLRLTKEECNWLDLLI